MDKRSSRYSQEIMASFIVSHEHRAMLKVHRDTIFISIVISLACLIRPVAIGIRAFRCWPCGFST